MHSTWGNRYFHAEHVLNTHTHTYHTHARMHAHTQIHAYAPHTTHMLACTHTHLHAHTPYTHLHAHTHHTYMHAHTHTHTHLLFPSPLFKLKKANFVQSNRISVHVSLHLYTNTENSPRSIECILQSLVITVATYLDIRV